MIKNVTLQRKVKLTNIQLNKLKFAAKYQPGAALKITKENFRSKELPHELLPTIRQNAFNINTSTDIKFSATLTWHVMGYWPHPVTKVSPKKWYQSLLPPPPQFLIFLTPPTVLKHFNSPSVLKLFNPPFDWKQTRCEACVQTSYPT